MLLRLTFAGWSTAAPAFLAAFAPQDAAPDDVLHALHAPRRRPVLHSGSRGAGALQLAARDRVALRLGSQLPPQMG